MDKNKILIIILAVVFGLAGGVVGEIVARVYILENTFGIPLYGDINYGNKTSGPNLIIRQAQKVVVEQNTMVQETAKSVSDSMAGIYLKAIPDEKIIGKDKNSQTAESIIGYDLSKSVGQAFIITSDGWLITNYLPVAAKNFVDKDFSPVKAKILIKQNYVIIDKNRKIYAVDNALFDKVSGYSFWHIVASDLPVRKFATKIDINSGQSVMAVNLAGWIWETNIFGLADKSIEAVKSSDICQSEIILIGNTPPNFKNAFLFNLGGDLIGILQPDNKLPPIFNFSSAILSLLQSQQLSRPALGLNYINLSNFASTDKKYGQGALIAVDKNNLAMRKGSPAEVAGFKAGDIITQMNNIDINADNDLCDFISQQKVGSEITLKYLRGETTSEVKVILGKL